MISSFRKRAFYLLFSSLILGALVFLFPLEVKYPVALLPITLMGLFLNYIFSNKLLYDICIEENELILMYYTIVFKKEELRIKKEEILGLDCKESGEATFKVHGTNGPIKKEFMLRIKPWDELTLKLAELKNSLPSNPSSK